MQIEVFDFSPITRQVSRPMQVYIWHRHYGSLLQVCGGGLDPKNAAAAVLGGWNIFAGKAKTGSCRKQT